MMPDKLPDWSDAAKRASDIVNGYRAFVPWDELKTKVIAIRLSDGGSDGVLYDSKREAVKHQVDEFLCAYVFMRNLMGGATPREMELYLKWNRDAYDAGMRMPDPMDVNGGPELIMTAGRHDQLSAKFPRMSPAEEQMMATLMGVDITNVDLIREMEKIIFS
jgi:hypothetical protein